MSLSKRHIKEDMSTDCSILAPSTLIKHRWFVTKKIGKGSFGETYAAVDEGTSQNVAIKIEQLEGSKNALRQEVIALRQLQGCQFVVRFIHAGRQDHYNYLVMERLGENLAELRKQQPNGTFSMCTSLRLGIQMIEALEGIHELGFVHRDVKPANFVMGHRADARKRGRAYLIDFGLARKYRLPNGTIRPPREDAGFRGTTRYASINSHKKRELGPVDDLWSVFYTLIEFLKGSLPWQRLSKEQVAVVKEKETNPDLCQNLPLEFVLFMEHLQNLAYEDTPDYTYLKNLLLQVYIREGYTDDTPFDWNVQQLISAAPNLGLSGPRNQDQPQISTLSTSITGTGLSISAQTSNPSTGTLQQAHMHLQYREEQQKQQHRRSLQLLPTTTVQETMESQKKENEQKKTQCKRCSIM